MQTAAGTTDEATESASTDTLPHHQYIIDLLATASKQLWRKHKGKQV